MGIFPGIAIVALLVVIAAGIVYSLWQRKALSAMIATAMFFAVVGIALTMLAAFDWVTDSTFGYTWGGLPQVAYDAPFVIALIFVAAATVESGRRFFVKRLDRAALAPHEQTVGSPARIR